MIGLVYKPEEAAGPDLSCFPSSPLLLCRHLSSGSICSPNS